MDGVAETTLRDALAGAFDSVESGVTPTEAPAELPTEESKGRDEAGRFAKRDNPEPSQEVTEAQPEKRKPPSSWKKDYWQKFESLDPELQDYIGQREQEYAKGVSTYKTEAERAKHLQEAIAPFVPEMEKYGVRPEVEIKNLLAAHHALVTADPQTKLRMFSKLATDYGVPLQGITGGNVDPQFMHISAELQALKSQFGQMYQTQEQREAAAAAAQIEQFKANAPHFDEVRTTMAGLLQAGMATDLQSAYDKAIRLSDEIWQKEQARQAEAAKAAEQKAIAERKAKAVSPKSSPPTAGAKATNGNDIRSALSQAFGLVESGRL